MPFVLMVSCALVFAGPARIVDGQPPLPDTAAAPAMPEPIYWKQDLFLVPYQWRTAAEAGAAQAVWLFVSKDRGATWQKISEAKPHVTSFSYRAEGDGEYWFAVRTIDKLGRTWPAGAYQPELRVIVDTMMPQLGEVTAGQADSGAIEITWRGSDANLDPGSLKIEAQTDTSGNWQPVPAEQLVIAGANSSLNTPGRVYSGQAMWTPPSGSRPLAIRATVSDLAGNPATYQAQITSAPIANFTTPPPTTAAAQNGLPTTPSPPTGWISSSAAAGAQLFPAPAAQPWPAVTTNRSPFRLFSSGPALPDDGITAYGNPPAITAAQPATGEIGHGDHRVAARYAGVVRGVSDPTVVPESPTVVRRSPDPAPPSFSPIEPYPHTSFRRLPTTSTADARMAETIPSESFAPPHTPPSQPKLVGSRTFALEYDVDDVGRWGVTKVELWGTCDGGRTWHSYARDDDQRSPLVATVDEEGLYGFRIVVESAGTMAQPPNPGDEPELWVTVDLHRPVIELTAIERGAGNLSDHLILRWRADDDNLEPRPISLFYSSRPAGPWSAIATNLANTGEYPWRVERYVPARFYLRLEARDTAGNLAAFQTREPIEFSPIAPEGQLLDAESMGPTATGIEPSFR